MDDLTYYNEYYGESHKIQESENCSDYQDPAQSESYYRAYDQASQHTIENSVFHSADAKVAFFDYQNMGIDSAHTSPSVLIRAFSLLDRRYGKACHHALIIRCRADGPELNRVRPQMHTATPYERLSHAVDLDNPLEVPFAQYDELNKESQLAYPS